MSVDEVIQIKGALITRADLGSKTILTCSDLKFVFEVAKLLDVQVNCTLKKQESTVGRTDLDGSQSVVSP
jgi:hypothetical protein